LSKRFGASIIVTPFDRRNYSFSAQNSAFSHVQPDENS
jgi:hypothetical protein